MRLLKKKYPSFCGPVPLVSIKLHSGEEVKALDLRGNKDARWLRASNTREGLSFSVRKGDDPARKDRIIGRISNGGRVSISRHEDILVFKDDDSAMGGPMCYTPSERVSRMILPSHIVLSWPQNENNRKKVDDIVPKENGSVFFPQA